MNYNNVPEILKQRGLWCVWRRGEQGKIPFDPNTGYHAKSNDPSTFSGFQTAYNACQSGGYAGLGIGISDNIGAIDIDHCITDGRLSDMAEDIIRQMGSYTETSPSGEGIRIIFMIEGFSYDKERYYINNHKKGLEIYIAGATKKFVTITGNKLNDNPVVDGTSKLPIVLEKYMRRDTVQTGSAQPTATAPTNTENYLQIGLGKDKKLKEYWNGARPHENESEDDAGLMAKLMYWCNNNADSAIKAFRSSPYASQKDEKHQKKIERPDYLPNLAKAMKADRTAAQEHEQWEREHCRQAKRNVSKGLSIISAQELQKADLPPTKYLVEDFLPEGTSLLAAAPKSGKSWFVLLLGLKIAAGEMFLQCRTNQVGVLYLSFEDTKKRLQGRINQLLSNAPAPPWFYISTERITLEDGLLGLIEEHIKQHPETKLIIIDTFQKIRGQIQHGERWYDHDYREAGTVKEFMDKKGLSVLFVHHTSKTKDKEDPFNEIGGTNGISGAMDTMLVMKKKLGQPKLATLYLTGRDVAQDELVIHLDENTCQWELVGDADELAEREKLREYQSSPIVKTIRELVNASPEKRWSGVAKKLLQEGERIFEIPIAHSCQQLGKELVKFRELLQEQDSIVYSASSNGNAGNVHHFFLDKRNADEGGNNIEH